ncbi:hypothetical protein [Aureivirga sp. CE67]|uniref:hypothetical protein n=1 Tax=Aureivirga sp. CE67 TaxID=1788983 RepID=UPI0018C9105F|nr:hypothetical protein [Aureivirga sp. CE67]
MKKNYLLKISSLLIFSLFIVLSTGCAAKKYRKQAMQLEKAGLVEDAAELYRKSLTKQPDNIEAKLGLRKNGQIVLDRKSDVFLKSYNTGTNKEAVYKFLEVQNYYNKIKAVGITLDFPTEHNAYFEEKKSLYLGELYDEGKILFDKDNFSHSGQKFSEIVKIDSKFRDARHQLNRTKAEPKYRQGIEYLNNNTPRKAYYEFKSVASIIQDYKDVVQLKNEALENATINIVVIPFQNERRNSTLQNERLQSIVQNELNGINSPFYRIIDGSSIAYNDAKKMEKAKKLGGHAIFTGVVSKNYHRTGKLRRESKRGYLRKKYKQENKDGTTTTVTKYEKIEYSEYSMTNQANLELRYQLIATNNNEMWISDEISIANQDAIHYAKSNHNYKNIVKGYWEHKSKKSSSDKVYDDYRNNKELKNLFKGSKEISSSDYLLKTLMQEAGKQIKNEVERFNPEN